MCWNRLRCTLYLRKESACAISPMQAHPRDRDPVATSRPDRTLLGNGLDGSQQAALPVQNASTTGASTESSTVVLVSGQLAATRCDAATTATLAFAPLFLFARTSTTRCWDRDVVRCCFGSRVDERTVKHTGWGRGLGPTVPGGLGRDPSGTVISRVGTGGRVLCTLLGGLRQRGPSEHTRYLGLSTGKRIFQWDNNEPDLDFGLTAFASLQQRTRKKKKRQNGGTLLELYGEMQSVAGNKSNSSGIFTVHTPYHTLYIK